MTAGPFGFSGAGVDNFSGGFRVALGLEVVSSFLAVSFFSLAAVPRFCFVAVGAEVPFLAELEALDFALGFTAFVLALADAFFFGVARPLVEAGFALLAATFFFAAGFFLAGVFLPAGALVLDLAPDFRVGVFFRDTAIISPSAFLGMAKIERAHYQNAI